MDSSKERLSFEEAVSGTNAPVETLASLLLLDIPLLSFDGNERIGQILVHQDIEHDVRDIFAELLRMRFPIEQMRPHRAYDWNDEASMEANNTAAFNYRKILGSDTLSNHSFGRAIDINPRLNPYYARDGRVLPSTASYDASIPGTFTTESPAVALFKSRGWIWGGDWTTPVDYQHFEKP